MTVTFSKSQIEAALRAADADAWSPLALHFPNGKIITIKPGVTHAGRIEQEFMFEVEVPSSIC